jgi:hypothetical protein
MDTVENNKKDTYFCHFLTILQWFNFDLLSEGLLCSAISAIFQLYYDMNKLIFNEMMTRSALY